MGVRLRRARAVSSGISALLLSPVGGRDSPRWKGHLNLPILGAEVLLMRRPRSRRAASRATPFPDDAKRLYAICVFDEALVVPWVKLVDAESDRVAIALARSIQPSKRREIWDRQRLVAELPEAPASCAS